MSFAQHQSPPSWRKQQTVGVLQISLDMRQPEILSCSVRSCGTGLVAARRSAVIFFSDACLMNSAITCLAGFLCSLHVMLFNVCMREHMTMVIMWTSNLLLE